MRLPRTPFLIFPLFVLLLLNFSCRKEETLDSSPGLQLTFSTDTVFFDTVFPTVGSVTQRLIVRNTNENKVSVSSIRLAGGQASPYRININGIPGTSIGSVEIPGGDSLYVFVKVTIDPNNENIPFIVTDSLEFVTNGTLQNVKLVAWGRNAIFYRKGVIRGTVIWDSLRAHVIYESLRVDTNSTLIIMPGTRVYFHMNAWMAVSYQSTLKISGTVDHPVGFQGDRMDPFYEDLPGQWGGIYLDPGSKDHELNYANIKNGTFGLMVDSLGSLGPISLAISNSIIQNMAAYGIYSYGASITSINCVIADCGWYSLFIEHGGAYDFRQLTVGNFWYASVRHSPSVSLSNYSYDLLGNQLLNPLSKCYFGNLILYGANEEEIALDSVPGATFSYTFDHAILKTKLKTSDPAHYIQCMVNKDPVFVDISKLDYRIDSISPAINAGMPLGILLDITGIDRGTEPDLGAYEYRKY